MQQLVPTMAAKDNVSQLDIILEAIRYIDSLRVKLEDKVDNGDLVTLQSGATLEETWTFGISNKYSELWYL